MVTARFLLVVLFFVGQPADSASTFRKQDHVRTLSEPAVSRERLMRKEVHGDAAGLSASSHEGEGVQDAGGNHKSKRTGERKSACSINSTAMASVQGDFPVDVVYTWIKQPSKEEYEQILEDCPKLTGGWQRFRNLNTFKFSLRMLEKYMPWVRTVFIVTPGEAPDWLNTDNPKVRVITQKDLWTKDQYAHDQPIHNSQPVEVHLHRIPGLATHFIYFNDDMFVGHSLEKSFFFTDEGKPVLHMYDDPKFPMLQQHDPQWCQLSEPSHFPVTDSAHIPGAFTIPLIEDAQARWPRLFENISSAHCRGDIRVDWGPTYFYQWFGWQSGLIEIQEPVRTVFLCDQVVDRHAWYKQTLSDPPYLGCINDDFDVDDDARFVEEKNELMAFMANYSAGFHGSFVRDTRLSLLTLDKKFGIVEMLIEQEDAKSF